jgi:hypothetical protein
MRKSAYSNDGDPFGHGEAEAAEGAVLAGRVGQQTNGGEEADPVEKERDHECTQKDAVVANVLREILQLGVGRRRRLIEESQLPEIDIKTRSKNGQEREKSLH